MPRHTHPRPVRKHSRAHTREQRLRWGQKRFNRALHIYSGYNSLVFDHTGEWPGEAVAPYRLDPRIVMQNPRQYGSLGFIYPFHKHFNEWADNWQCYCSCGICKRHRKADEWRAQEKRAWQKETLMQLQQRDEYETND